MDPTTAVDLSKWKEDKDLGYKLNFLFWSLSILSGLAVGLRLYTKTRSQQAGLWWDDWVAVASWLLILLQNIAASFELRQGQGIHASELPFDEISQFILSANVAATLAIIVTTSTKSGFCITLLNELDVWPGNEAAVQPTQDTEGARLNEAPRGERAAAIRDGQTAKSALRGIVWSVLAIMNIVSMVCGILLWVRCSPMHKGWHPNVEGTCWGETASITPPRVNTAVTGTMDVFLSVLPLYMLRSIPLRVGERVGIMFCVSLGLFAAVTGFFKTAEVHILAGNDVTFEIVPLTVWGSVEPNLILIAISLPEARHLFWKGSRYHAQSPTPQGMRDGIGQMAAGSGFKAPAADATYSTSARTSRDDMWEVLSYYGVTRSPSPPRATPPPRATVVVRPRDSWYGRHAQATVSRPREMGRGSRAARLYGRDAYTVDLRGVTADIPARARRSK